MDVDTGCVVPDIAPIVQTRIDGEASESLSIDIGRAPKSLHTDDMVDGYRSARLIQGDAPLGWASPIKAQEIEP